VFDSGGIGKKRKVEEVDLDITPMIDVTFLLLIFFMVTSTMQATPDKDIPPSQSGINAVVDGIVDVTIRASAISDGDVELNNRPVSLEQLRADLMLKSQDGKFKVVLYVERDVKSGTVGEVEGVIGEVAKEAEVEIDMAFAVRDR
jgi:biopolymer transport protein ExbD